MPEQTAPATATLLEKVMSKYTAEFVEAEVEVAMTQGKHGTAAMFREFATLLRERESAKAAVTDDVVHEAIEAYVISDKAAGVPRFDAFKVALEAVAPMLTRARAPDGYTALLSDGKRYWSDKPGQHGEWLPYYLGVPVDGYVMPKGWQLVPAELTLSMSVRGKWALCDHSIKPEDFKRAWREMLAAAPKPETEE